MAYTRSKKAPKKAKTRARKLALAGSAKPRARPSAAKRSTPTTNTTPTPTPTPAEVHSDTDEDLLGAANSIVSELGKITRSLEKPKASFWKKHGSNLAVVIRRVPSFDPSRYQRVEDEDEDVSMDNTATTPPSSYKKVRFDRQVEEIGSSGGMSGILTAAKFGDSEDEESSSSDETDEAELSEDELSESVRRITRSRGPIKPKNHGFAVVIKKSPALTAPVTPTPAASGVPRVTRHATTTRHQFRLAVTGNPAAVPSSTTTSEAVSVRSLIHSRIDDKYAASRTRATAATIAANRPASKASNAKNVSTFATGVVQKNTRGATIKRTSGRIAVKASKAKIVDVDDDDEEEDDEKESEGESEEEEESDEDE
ncbi:uncharacterized protein H6S33_007832 [Morchella sextelata]|uniref:uncharacterized protein n=1 Tax=Morchella sextelata TaxID=1174677 RepID=UPI001D046938|nr:uncharacterized protein H6S33_007832 [Morchella sextelata]KAH0603510.1 hypothetical protein H6S33_007832 [Morchella sextelata]